MFSTPVPNYQYYFLLNFQCPDGGGVRGLSALIILEHFMDRANRKHKEQGLEPQEPWQMFHLIGGTSTGGYVCTPFIDLLP
jgi:hypothetical protein